MKTSISFLKSKYNRIETIEKIEQTSADFIHVDIMDGRFVENEVLSIEETLSLFKNHKKPLDIHLMVKYPLDYIEKLSTLNPEYITIHYELNLPIIEYFNIIRNHGIKVGIAINPDTEVSEVYKYLNEVDYVIVMGVYPGAGGQKLIPECVNKVTELKKFRKEKNLKYLISIDGGVNKETRPLLNDLDVLVSGSFVCVSDDYEERINELK